MHNCRDNLDELKKKITGLIQSKLNYRANLNEPVKEKEKMPCRKIKKTDTEKT